MANLYALNLINTLMVGFFELGYDSGMSNADRKKSLMVSVGLFLSSLIALSSWAVSSPVAASPDESVHLAGIWCANGPTSGQCSIAEDGRPIVPAKLNNWCYQHNQNESAKCTSRIESNEAITIRAATKPNVITKVLELFVGNEIGTRVVLMRLVTIAFLLSLVAALFSLSDKRHRAAIVLTCAIVFVPSGLYFISAIHPSGMASVFLLVFGITVSQMVKMKIENRKPQVMLIALMFASLLLSLQIRSEAFIFAGLISFLFLATTWLSESKLTFRYKTFLVTAALTVLGISVLVLVRYTSLPLTLNVWGTPINPERANWNIMTTNFQQLPSMYLGNFGYWALGALDVPLPAIVWSSVGIVFVGAVTVNALTSSVRNLLFGTLVFLFSAALILSILKSSKLYVGEQMQPRYILPFVAMAFAIFIANGRFAMPERSNFVYLSSIAVALLGMANSISLWITLRRYTSGLDIGELDLNYNREWWWNFPLDPNQVWFLGTVSFGTAVSLGIYSVVFTKSDRSLQGIEGSRI